MEYSKLAKGTPVATGYTVNNYDTPRIRSLLMTRKTEPQMSPDCDLSDTHEREPETPAVNLRDANIGQLTPAQEDRLMTLLDQYRDILSVNSEAVEAYGGPPMILELKDPKSKPHVTNSYPESYMLYTPEQRNKETGGQWCNTRIH